MVTEGKVLVDEFTNKKLLIQYLLKYKNFRNKSALAYLNTVDLIRNNYNKSTLTLYLCAIRKYINKNEKTIGVPSYIYPMIDNLRLQHYPSLKPCENDKYVESRKEPIKKQKPETRRKPDSFVLVDDKNNILVSGKEEFIKGYLACYNKLKPNFNCSIKRLILEDYEG